MLRRVGSEARRSAARVMTELESVSRLVPLIALLAAILIPAYAGIVRGRSFAIFSGVILLFSVSGIVISHERLGDWLASTAPALRPVLDFTFAYLMLAAALQLSSLVKARLHGIPFRLLVTWPGQAFLAAGLLAAAWLLLLLVRHVVSPFLPVFWFSFPFISSSVPSGRVVFLNTFLWFLLTH